MFGPNIKGQVGYPRNHLNLNTGAFADSEQQNAFASASGSATDKWNIKIDFSASNYSSVYAGSTVQPPSLLALSVIKF